MEAISSQINLPKCLVDTHDTSVVAESMEFDQKGTRHWLVVCCLSHICGSIQSTDEQFSKFIFLHVHCPAPTNPQRALAMPSTGLPMPSGLASTSTKATRARALLRLAQA